MTRYQLERAISSYLPEVKKGEARKILNAIFNTMKRALKQKQTIQIVGFGTFFPFRTKPRLRYSLKEKKVRFNDSRVTVHFQPANYLRRLS